MASPAFYFDSQQPGEKLAAAASATVTATLDDISGVTFIEWEIIATDETTATSDYTLSVTSGAVPGAETTSFTAGVAGTAGLLRARINNGRDTQTGNASDGSDVIATGKWYVPTSGQSLEVGVVGEQFESDETFGSTGIINQAIRAVSAFASADVNPTADTIAKRGPSGQLKAVWFQNGDATVASTGLIRTANNFVAVAARNAGNTADINLIATNSFNNVLVGDADAAKIQLHVATGGVIEHHINGVLQNTISTNVILGASTGKLTAGGVDLIAVTGGGVTVGDDAAAGTTYRTATGNVHSWTVAGIQEMQLGAVGLIVSDIVQATAHTPVGGVPATAGLLRAEKNTTAVAFRNDGNTADIAAVAMSATDKLVIGDSTNAVGLEYRSNSSGAHTFYLNSTAYAEISAARVTVGNTSGPPVTMVAAVGETVALAEGATTLLEATTTGVSILTAPLNVTAASRESGSITPTVGTDQNDWAPAGIATCTAVFVNVTAPCTITGISSAGMEEGQTFTIYNTSTNAANTLTLAHDSGSSSAGNKFILPNNANVVIPRGGAATVRHHAASTVFRLKSISF